jgi:hypothetical protein
MFCKVACWGDKVKGLVSIGINILYSDSVVAGAASVELRSSLTAMGVVPGAVGSWEVISCKVEKGGVFDRRSPVKILAAKIHTMTANTAPPIRIWGERKLLVHVTSLYRSISVNSPAFFIFFSLATRFNNA